jgi:hypothetical protein
MNVAIVAPLIVVILCSLTLYGCYIAFDRLQTRAEQSTGSRRWTAIAAAGAVGVVALCSFWACFAFSTGLFQALGLNLR